MRSRFVPAHALLAMSIVALIPIPSRAAPGALDPTFGSGGEVITAIGSGDDVATAVAIQSDGKIVAVGQTFTGAQNAFVVVRYTSSGALDPAFGGTGIVTTPIGSTGDTANAVAIQPDGKIVVGGVSYQGPVTHNDFALVRYNTDGSLDGSFGSGGKVTTAVGTSTDTIGGLAIQADGTIIAAGSTFTPQSEFVVVRYDASGVPDPSFGSGGIAITPVGAYNDAAHAVALQSDGKIVVAGSSSDGSYNDFALVRYATNGSLDASFGTGGKVTTPVGVGNDSAYGVAIQGDGKIVAAGGADQGLYSNFGLVRYGANGSLDSSFGTGGKVATGIGASATANAVVIQTDDGRIVAAGSTTTGAVRAWALARYLPDGSSDSSFGSGGTVTTPFGTMDDAANGVALQQDGKIVAAGYTKGASNLDVAVARYDGGGAGVATTTTTTTLPPGSACDGLAGIARARCKLARLLADALCADPIPASVAHALQAKLKAADGLLGRAAAASGKKQGRFLKKARGKLDAVTHKAAAAAKAKNAKKRITSSCATTIGTSVADVAGDLPASGT